MQAKLSILEAARVSCVREGSLGIVLAPSVPEHSHRFSPLRGLCIPFKSPGGVTDLSFAMPGHLLLGVMTGGQCASGGLERKIKVGEARQPVL